MAGASGDRITNRRVRDLLPAPLRSDLGPPGPILTEGDRFLIPGKLFGNIFVGIQPPRGFLEEAEAIYHSTDLVMPHHYLAYYWWRKERFGAQAVVHLGTHGTLEWLPGKGTALSSSCYPAVVLDDLPHLYPYVIDNPGEEIQAKRRSWAVILDHLIPAMTRAGGYGDLEELTPLLQEYFRASRNGEEAKTGDLLGDIARFQKRRERKRVISSSTGNNLHRSAHR